MSKFTLTLVGAMLLLPITADAQTYGVATTAGAGGGTFSAPPLSFQQQTSGSATASYTGYEFGSAYGSSSGTTSASLVNGSIKAYGISEGYSGSVSAARMFDTLYFDLGSDPNASTLVTLLFSFHGDVSLASGSRGQGTGLLYAGGHWSTPRAGLTMSYGTPHPQTPVGFQASGTNFDSFSWAEVGSNHWLATATYRVSSSEARLGLMILAGLQTTTFGNATADFGNTANLRVLTEPGVTYRSASGEFLSGLTSAVPEPGTWAMMLLGFGAIGVSMRHRSQVKPIAQLA